MKNAEETMYLRDSFFYLVANGLCHAYRSGVDMDHPDGTHWTVSLNGRMYVEKQPQDPNYYIFTCVTDYGSVQVNIPRKEFK